MKNCPTFETLSAYADGESAPGDAWVESHLQGCADCRAVLADIAVDTAALRSEASAVVAPSRLTDWLERRSADLAASPRPVAAGLSRRAALLGGAAAAAAGAGVVYFAPLRSVEGGPMAPTLFRDFATRVAADRALDFPHQRMHDVAEWFDARLPFLAPRPAALERLALRGGRLCWLLDRRVAAVHFEHKGRETCFYAAQARGLTLSGDRKLPKAGAAPALLSVSGAAGAFWRDTALAYALVGAPPLAAIAELAQTLRRAA